MIHLDCIGAATDPAGWATNLETLSILAHSIPCLPYDLLISVDDLEQANRLLTDCLDRNKLLHSMIVHFADSGAARRCKLDSLALFASQLQCRLGIAFGAAGFDSIQLEALLTRLEVLPIGEVLLVYSQDQSEVQQQIRLLLGPLSRWARARSRATVIGLSDGLGIIDLAASSDVLLGHLVANETLLTSSHLQGIISGLRRLLRPPTTSSARPIRLSHNCLRGP